MYLDQFLDQFLDQCTQVCTHTHTSTHTHTQTWAHTDSNQYSIVAFCTTYNNYNNYKELFTETNSYIYKWHSIHNCYSSFIVTD